jgi:hypothetical protein
MMKSSTQGGNVVGNSSFQLNFRTSQLFDKIWSDDVTHRPAWELITWAVIVVFSSTRETEETAIRQAGTAS